MSAGTVTVHVCLVLSLPVCREAGNSNKMKFLESSVPMFAGNSSTVVESGSFNVCSSKS